MNYNHPARNSSTVGLRLMCAAVFIAFSFCYLYFFQSDLLAFAQHRLSNGLTQYQPLVGAVLITAVLQLLQIVIYAIARLKKRSHALTYLPSMLILGILTDVDDAAADSVSLGSWYWLFPLLLVLWAGVTFLAKAMQDIEPDNEPAGLLSRPMWINLLTMSLFIIITCSIGNTNDVLHYRMRMENMMLRGEFSERLLDTGRRSLESDANLQMLRMYALSRQGLLGERLFEYPVSGTSSVMLPVEGRADFAMYPADSLYRYLGAYPARGMTCLRYLQLLQQRDSAVNRPVADYQLCGLLLDKRIDDFALALSQLYSIGDTLQIGDIPQSGTTPLSGTSSLSGTTQQSGTTHLSSNALPRYYREALILYNHLRSHPRIVFHDSVMDEDWANLQELESRYPDPTARKYNVMDQYLGTYWYYYEYGDSGE